MKTALTKKLTAMLLCGTLVLGFAGTVSAAPRPNTPPPNRPHVSRPVNHRPNPQPARSVKYQPSRPDHRQPHRHEPVRPIHHQPDHHTPPPDRHHHSHHHHGNGLGEALIGGLLLALFS